MHADLRSWAWDTTNYIAVALREKLLRCRAACLSSGVLELDAVRARLSAAGAGHHGAHRCISNPCGFRAATCARWSPLSGVWHFNGNTLVTACLPNLCLVYVLLQVCTACLPGSCLAHCHEVSCSPSSVRDEHASQHTS
jgi:hypothetical protein